MGDCFVRESARRTRSARGSMEGRCGGVVGLQVGTKEGRREHFKAKGEGGVDQGV